MAYINEHAKLTILGLIDTAGNIKYAIYDNGEYILYNENKASELLLYIDNKSLDGYNQTKVIINEIEYNANEINLSEGKTCI